MRAGIAIATILLLPFCSGCVWPRYRAEVRLQDVFQEYDELRDVVLAQLQPDNKLLTEYSLSEPNYLRLKQEFLEAKIIEFPGETTKGDRWWVSFYTTTHSVTIDVLPGGKVCKIIVFSMTESQSENSPPLKEFKWLVRSENEKWNALLLNIAREEEAIRTVGKGN